ncbi:MAG: hypothetical protein WAV51_03985 [Microgenomates group bacterium]
MHKIIIIPGLGDESIHLRLITRHWKRFGLDTVVYPVGWFDEEKQFMPKLNRLLKLVDGFVKDGHTVSLIGNSAGGSAVLNIFAARKDVIHRVINICGRVRTGTTKGFRSFENRTSSSPAFAQSIKMAEEAEKSFTAKDRVKIMTIHPIFDELVPDDTLTIQGATNIQIPMVFHSPGILSALTIFSKLITLFLEKS